MSCLTHPSFAACTPEVCFTYGSVPLKCQSFVLPPLFHIALVRSHFSTTSFTVCELLKPTDLQRVPYHTDIFSNLAESLSCPRVHLPRYLQSQDGLSYFNTWSKGNRRREVRQLIAKFKSKLKLLSPKQIPLRKPQQW